MSKRTLTIMLCITLLLLIRVADHLGVSQTNDTQHSVATHSPIASLPERSFTPALPLSIPNSEPVAPVSHLSASNSLAQLEAFLIPEAKAGANSIKQYESSLPIDDKTLTSLRSFKSELDKKATELDKRDRELAQAEEKLHQRIAELEQLEASIKQRLKDEAGIKTKKIKRLTSVYEGMKANKAAPVIAQMELTTVVKIFSLMDEKKVGKILSYLPADKAVTISQALTRQISTVK